MDKNNVFTFTLAPGYRKFHAFCSEFQIDPYEDDHNPAMVCELYCQPATGSTDNEEQNAWNFRYPGANVNVNTLFLSTVTDLDDLP